MALDRLLEALLARADRGAQALVMVGAATKVIVVFAQVVMRYVFNSSFDWADEVSRLAFVWTIFLGIPLGIRDGVHVGIELLVTRLPAVVRQAVSRLMSITAAGMMAIVFWITIGVALATWSERLGAINVTSSVFFLPIVIGSLHSALHLLRLSLHPPEPRI
jgi:TRAP-type transport system small permease protein